MCIHTSKCVVSLGWISPAGNCTAVNDVLMLPLRAQLNAVANHLVTSTARSQ